MKMMFIVDDYSGGAGNIIQLLATEYAKENDVTVLLTNHTVEKRYKCENVKFIELDSGSKPKGIKAVLFQIKWIKKQIKYYKPEVVISFITGNSIFTGIGMLFSRVPLIVCERICPVDLRLNLIWKLLMKIAYTRANAVTVQFDSFKFMYNGNYLNKCYTTPNYIAKPDKEKCISSERNEKVRFVSCGRLNASKQFETMISMFGEIHKELPASELHIYGRGPYQGRLEVLISNMGLNDSVFLEGYTTDTYGVLVDSDVYFMTSKSEGFPNALSEAMAVGLPSVSFSCNPGIDELADYGKRGIVVPLNDNESFISATLKLCENIELQKSISDQAKVVSSFYSMENVKKSWDDVIQKVIKADWED